LSERYIASASSGSTPIHVRGDARDQPAAANRHEYRMEIARMLAQDFHADRALPRDDVGVVVRMHEGQPAPARQRARVRVGFVVGVSAQHHRSAARLDGADLDLRRGDRHDDRGPAAQPLGGQRHALGMIAGGGGDHAALQGGCRQSRHLVIRAAHLEGKHRLQVLALQQHATAGARRQPGRELERRLDGDVVHARREDLLEVIVFLHGGCDKGP
jgi:hypothetical protein